MPDPEPSSRRVRILAGEVEAKSVTSRTVIPSARQGAWGAFQRVGEVIATVDRKLPAHGHERQEVLTYGVEGFATVAIGDGPAQSLDPHTVVLLTSPAKTTHAISPARGSTVRWVSLVVGLPDGSNGAVRAQWGRPTASAPQPDGSVVRRLVGAGTGVVSASGLEASEIAFASSGTSFLPVGHDRQAVVYALSGRGQVDAQPVEEGEAALVEESAGLGLHGRPGFRVILATVPRSR